MDRLKNKRRPVRAALTRVTNEVDVEIAKDQPDHDVLGVSIKKLERIVNEIQDLDQEILDVMLDANCTYEEQDEERILIDEYRDRAELSSIKINKVLYPHVRPASQEGSVYHAAASSHGQKKTYKLPKIQIKKFNGDLTEWLSFWSQFQKIHEDDELHASDKFQYLLQSMTKETRAYDLVVSYPQTADNYPKVVEALKGRFGKEKLLKQVYVRELLKLVINNNRSSEKVKVAQMYDKLESHLRALESLGVTPEQTGVFLYPMVESSLREDILVAWQRSPLNGIDGSKEAPPKSELDYLMEFLRKEVENEDQRTLAQNGFSDFPSKESVVQGNGRKPRFHSEEVPTVAGLHIGDRPKCIFCENQHESKECRKASTMSIEDKQKRIKEKNCCFICIRPGHGAANCKAFVTCQICQRRHLTMMCQELPKPGQKGRRSPPPSNLVKTVIDQHASASQVILGTLYTTIREGNQEKEVRIFLDSGAHKNYVTLKTAREMKLPSQGDEKLIHGLFGGTKTDVQVHPKFEVELKNADGQNFTIFSALGQKQICDEIPRMPKGPWMKELKKKRIRISDVGYGCPEIDILLGANAFPKLFTGRKHVIQDDLATFETILGWVVMGEPLESKSGKSSAMIATSMHISDSTVEQLWSLEALGIRDPVESLSQAEKEKAATQHFLQTVTRAEDGRYAVSLPWISGRQKIPQNRRMAEHRLNSATKKLHQLGKFKDYGNIFKAWNEEGIIEEVCASDDNVMCHYLPHRAVLKPDSLTTPVRPVFDASCKSDRNPSLNDCLEKGPNLMELIPSVLLRFREKKIGVISDIRKAFQMIEMHEEDRNFVRFLWWEDDNQKSYKIYRHKRVVFGVNCSPFLLAAVLELHLKAVQAPFVDIASKLLKSLYVDNCVTSVDSIEEYEKFKKHSTRIMAEAKMELRVWQCSSMEESRVGSTINECGLETDRAATEDLTSVLGLKWNMRNDTMCVDFEMLPVFQKITKREILACVQRVFDPLGLVSPALLFPKRILQEAWALKTSWDDELPEEIQVKFRNWYEDLQLLREIKFPRNCTGGNRSRETWQIHTFGDASQDAYSAMVFLRTGKEKEVSIQLLQAKSRVSPLKKATIPRLELMACTIGARLTVSVKAALDMEDVPTYYWSDSTTALAWIQRNDEWGTFVGNRVREILRLTKCPEWKHVPGVDNPADLPSRGCSPQQLFESSWWEGPEWLRKPPSAWIWNHGLPVDEEEVSAEKKKKVTVALLDTEFVAPWYAKKASYFENIRIVAFVKRFIGNARGLKPERGWLKVREIQAAEDAVVKMIQLESFKHGSETISGIPVQWNELGDKLGRVKSKLLYSEDTFNFRYPKLLPHSHLVVDQLIEEYHRTYDHSGAQFLLGKLRENFWILQGKKAIKRVIGRCTICRRFTSKKSESAPSPLPANRVNLSRVNEIVGVDLAGPLYLKDKKKAWILIVTCAVYRCVHLEVVESLSTEDFLRAFTRFMNRRGRPLVVYSDNGTNFVGANNLFEKMDWEKVTKQCSLQKIEWKFNPPSAAWWGGWWERLIRTVKDLLRRILGKSCVTYQKLQDYLCDIEACINGRPLTTVTEDPEDLIPLTPAMFLNEIPAVSYTELDFTRSNDLQQLYKERQSVLVQFKKRFRSEYLALLVERRKMEKTRDLVAGEVVLVGDDNRRRWEWPLARILELIPGKDGHVRVAKVKTAKGVITRPIQRLYPLEVDSPTIFAEVVEMMQSKSINSKEKGKKKVRFEDVNLARNVDPAFSTQTRSGRIITKPDRLGH